MHTDEFEISLSREIDVCKMTINRLQKSLRETEKGYDITTEEFAGKYRKGEFSADSKAFADWFDNYEALKRWEKRKTDFEELFYRMKI